MTIPVCKKVLVIKTSTRDVYLNSKLGQIVPLVGRRSGYDHITDKEMDNNDVDIGGEAGCILRYTDGEWLPADFNIYLKLL